eukprot:155677-Pelagomonas_calceolata.AAC.1
MAPLPHHHAHAKCTASTRWHTQCRAQAWHRCLTIMHRQSAQLVHGGIHSVTLRHGTAASPSAQAKCTASAQ